jgi:hypothetical protein
MSLFHVGNRHGTDSGTPPVINGNEPGRYFGYFQNEYREQAVFVYDYQEKTGTLWMSDAGWDEPAKVIGGEAPDLILGGSERLWLQACWMAATGSQVE